MSVVSPGVGSMDGTAGARHGVVKHEPRSQGGSGKRSLNQLNPSITCSLCKGYLINAMTLIRCMHSFCKSCIHRHLDTSNACPTCQQRVFRSRMDLHMMPDEKLQSIVYKTVPGLYASEMRRRREFYESLGDKNGGGGGGSEDKKWETEEQGFPLRNIVTKDDQISLLLEHGQEEASSVKLCNRYLSCAACVPLRVLIKFLRNKFSPPPTLSIHLLHDSCLLDPDFTLIDVCYIANYKFDVPLKINYRFVQIEPSVTRVSEHKITETIKRQPNNCMSNGLNSSQRDNHITLKGVNGNTVMLNTGHLIASNGNTIIAKDNVQYTKYQSNLKMENKSIDIPSVVMVNKSGTVTVPTSHNGSVNMSATTTSSSSTINNENIKTYSRSLSQSVSQITQHISSNYTSEGDSTEEEVDNWDSNVSTTIDSLTTQQHQQNVTTQNALPSSPTAKTAAKFDTKGTTITAAGARAAVQAITSNHSNIQSNQLSTTMTNTASKPNISNKHSSSITRSTGTPGGNTTASSAVSTTTKTQPSNVNSSSVQSSNAVVISSTTSNSTSMATSTKPSNETIATPSSAVSPSSQVISTNKVALPASHSSKVKSSPIVTRPQSLRMSTSAMTTACSQPSNQTVTSSTVSVDAKTSQQPSNSINEKACIVSSSRSPNPVPVVTAATPSVAVTVSPALTAPPSTPVSSSPVSSSVSHRRGSSSKSSSNQRINRNTALSPSTQQPSSTIQASATQVAGKPPTVLKIKLNTSPTTSETLTITSPPINNTVGSRDHHQRSPPTKEIKETTSKDMSFVNKTVANGTSSSDNKYHHHATEYPTVTSIKIKPLVAPSNLSTNYEKDHRNHRKSPSPNSNGKASSSVPYKDGETSGKKKRRSGEEEKKKNKKAKKRSSPAAINNAEFVCEQQSDLLSSSNFGWGSSALLYSQLRIPSPLTVPFTVSYARRRAKQDSEKEGEVQEKLTTESKNNPTPQQKFLAENFRLNKNQVIVKSPQNRIWRKRRHPSSTVMTPEIKLPPKDFEISPLLQGILDRISADSKESSFVDPDHETDGDTDGVILSGPPSPGSSPLREECFQRPDVTSTAQFSSGDHVSRLSQDSEHFLDIMRPGSSSSGEINADVFRMEFPVSAVHPSGIERSASFSAAPTPVPCSIMESGRRHTSSDREVKFSIRDILSEDVGPKKDKKPASEIKTPVDLDLSCVLAEGKSIQETVEQCITNLSAFFTALETCSEKTKSRFADACQVKKLTLEKLLGLVRKLTVVVAPNQIERVLQLESAVEKYFIEPPPVESIIQEERPIPLEELPPPLAMTKMSPILTSPPPTTSPNIPNPPKETKNNIINRPHSSPKKQPQQPSQHNYHQKQQMMLSQKHPQMFPQQQLQAPLPSQPQLPMGQQQLPSQQIPLKNDFTIANVLSNLSAFPVGVGSGLTITAIDTPKDTVVDRDPIVSVSLIEVPKPPAIPEPPRQPAKHQPAPKSASSHKKESAAKPSSSKAQIPKKIDQPNVSIIPTLPYLNNLPSPSDIFPENVLNAMSSVNKPYNSEELNANLARLSQMKLSLERFIAKSVTKTPLPVPVPVNMNDMRASSMRVKSPEKSVAQNPLDLLKLEKEKSKKSTGKNVSSADKRLQNIAKKQSNLMSQHMMQPSTSVMYDVARIINDMRMTQMAEKARDMKAVERKAELAMMTDLIARNLAEGSQSKNAGVERPPNSATNKPEASGKKSDSLEKELTEKRKLEFMKDVMNALKIRLDAGEKKSPTTAPMEKLAADVKVSPEEQRSEPVKSFPPTVDVRSAANVKLTPSVLEKAEEKPKDPKTNLKESESKFKTSESKLPESAKECDNKSMGSEENLNISERKPETVQPKAEQIDAQLRTTESISEVKQQKEEEVEKNQPEIVVEKVDKGVVNASEEVKKGIEEKEKEEVDESDDECGLVIEENDENIDSEQRKAEEKIGEQKDEEVKVEEEMEVTETAEEKCEIDAVSEEKDVPEESIDDGKHAEAESVVCEEEDGQVKESVQMVDEVKKQEDDKMDAETDVDEDVAPSYDDDEPRCEDSFHLEMKAMMEHTMESARVMKYILDKVILMEEEELLKTPPTSEIDVSVYDDVETDIEMELDDDEVDQQDQQVEQVQKPDEVLETTVVATNEVEAESEVGEKAVEEVPVEEVAEEEEDGARGSFGYNMSKALVPFRPRRPLAYTVALSDELTTLEPVRSLSEDLRLLYSTQVVSPKRGLNTNTLTAYTLVEPAQPEMRLIPYVERPSDPVENLYQMAGLLPKRVPTPLEVHDYILNSSPHLSRLPIREATRRAQSPDSSPPRKKIKADTSNTTSLFELINYRSRSLSEVSTPRNLEVPQHTALRFPTGGASLPGPSGLHLEDMDVHRWEEVEGVSQNLQIPPQASGITNVH